MTRKKCKNTKRTYDIIHRIEVWHPRGDELWENINTSVGRKPFTIKLDFSGLATFDTEVFSRKNYVILVKALVLVMNQLYLACLHYFCKINLLFGWQQLQELASFHVLLCLARFRLLNKTTLCYSIFSGFVVFNIGECHLLYSLRPKLGVNIWFSH